MNSLHSSTLHFNEFTLDLDNDKRVYPVYTTKSMKMVVYFIYGDDFQRQKDIFRMPQSVRVLYIGMIVFVILASIVLSFIRRKFNLRRGGLFSTCIDTCVAFINGGNLQMQHKWERWFFGILLIASFFLMAICTSDLLCFVYHIEDQKIDTFEELAQTQSPIYGHPIAKKFRMDIEEMFR